MGRWIGVRLITPSINPKETMSQILIIDNENDSCQTLSMTATRMGHSLTRSHNAAAAIKRIEAGGIDLIMLDLDMPAMGGWQVLHWLRSRFTPGELPVIGYCAAVDAEFEKMARELGVNECWIKTAHSFDNLDAAIDQYFPAPLRNAA
jgi:two-component system catabolic regulation response regulator CreB